MQTLLPLHDHSAGRRAPGGALGAGSLLLLFLLMTPGCGGQSVSEAAKGAADTAASGELDKPVGEGLVIQLNPSEEIGPQADAAYLRPNYHSFGRVPLGDKVSHVFFLKNTDDQPLTVTRMKAACGCTMPSISYLKDGEYVLGKSASSRAPELITIPAGVTAELKITMDSRNVPVTNVDKTVGVMLTTDSPNGFYLHVETHIFVQKPFTQNPSGINFNVTPINGTKDGKTDLILNPGYDNVLTGIASMPEGMQAELIKETSSLKPIWTLKATLAPEPKLGPWRGSLFIAQVNAAGEELEPLEVRMQARIVEDLLCEPSRIAFGVTREASGDTGGLSVTLKTLLSGHQFTIKELILSEEHDALFSTSFEAISPSSDGSSGSWGVGMICKPGAKIDKLTSGSIRVILDDPQHPETKVDYVVHPPRN